MIWWFVYCLFGGCVIYWFGYWSEFIILYTRCQKYGIFNIRNDSYAHQGCIYFFTKKKTDNFVKYFYIQDFNFIWFW